MAKAKQSDAPRIAKPKATFDEVMEAIRSERKYQLRRWGIRKSKRSKEFFEAHHSPDEFILYMEQYLTEARHAAAKLPNGHRAVLEALRKVVTLGVACFEIHGAPKRDIPDVVENARDGYIS